MSQDTDLLANVNSSQVGITGTALTPTTGRNQDDGNLNFNKHDAVSQVVNGYLSLEYKAGDYGGLVSTKLWYDCTLEKVGHPWGNIPNGLAPDAPLSDEGAQPRSRFGQVALDNLFLNGRHQVGAMPLEWKLGYQKVDWGNRFIVLGGLRDLNPDRHPGADPARHAAARSGNAHLGAADLRATGHCEVHVDRGLLPVRL